MDLRTKICRLCNNDKHIRCFNIRNKKSGNRRTECKLCLYSKQKSINPDNIITFSYLDRVIEPKKNKVITRKKCKQCGKIKKIDDYYRNKTNCNLVLKKIE